METLKRIASISYARRSNIMKDAQKHSANECNGNYWYDEEQDTYSTIQGNKLEQSIQKRINSICGGKQANFISWHGDPRGFVVKINSDKLTYEERAYCQETFVKDWGDDFCIIKRSEWDLYSHYN